MTDSGLGRQRDEIKFPFHIILGRHDFDVAIHEKHGDLALDEEVLERALRNCE